METGIILLPAMIFIGGVWLIVGLISAPLRCFAAIARWRRMRRYYKREMARLARLNEAE